MNRSNSTDRIVRAGTEFLVIVVGVLAALAVDQWRDTASEDRLRAEYVAGLIEDIELEITYMDLLEELGRSRIASADRVLLFLEAKSGPSLPDLNYAAPSSFDNASVARDLVAASQLQFLVPEAIVWQDLLETGNIRVLGDLELRRRVSRYYSQIRFQSRDLDHLRSRFSRLESYLSSVGTSSTDEGSVEPRLEGLRALSELPAFVRNARDTQAEILLRHRNLRSWADSALVQLRRQAGEEG